MQPGESPTEQLETPEQVVSESGANEPMLYCAVCSSRMIARKCKLLCAECGYYLSCADYY